jgi:hypothetical protein
VGGGKKVNADGVSIDPPELMEAKYIDKPKRSPYVDDSECPSYVRENAVKEVTDEFSRYAAVLRDPAVPASALDVIVSDAAAVPFFEALMKQFSIPGRVRVVAP